MDLAIKDLSDNHPLINNLRKEYSEKGTCSFSIKGNPNTYEGFMYAVFLDKNKAIDYVKKNPMLYQKESDDYKNY